MIDEKKLIEHIKGMSDTCNLFRWRSPKKIKEGIPYRILIFLLGILKKMEGVVHDRS